MARPGRVLVADGNSLCHRAWHALRRARLDGAWVAHGVVSMLATAVTHSSDTTTIAVAFDRPATRRRELRPDYKRHRERQPDEFYEHQAATRDLLDAAGAATASVEGWEADDVAASLTARSSELFDGVVLLSSDRDLVQLVGDTVTLLRPTGRGGPLEELTPSSVRERWGVDPSAYPLLAALRGDPSDGLDGVPGVGEKTAARIAAAAPDLADHPSGLDHPGLTDAQRRKLDGHLSTVRANLALTLLNDTLDVHPPEAATPHLDRLHRVLCDADLPAASDRLSRALAAARNHAG